MKHEGEQFIEHQEGEPTAESSTLDAETSAETTSTTKSQPGKIAKQKPRKELTTRFIIEQDSSYPATNEESGITADSRQISVGRRYSESASYYNLENLSKTQTVEVYMGTGLMTNERKLKKIDVPQKILDRLAFFLRNEREFRQCFDCGHFAYIMNDVPSLEHEDFNVRWNFHKLSSESDLKVGETILILDKEDSHYIFQHFAIYLGDGLYLSKFGQGGRLLVTNLEEMKKLFGGTITLKVTPKEDEDVSGEESSA